MRKFPRMGIAPLLCAAGLTAFAAPAFAAPIPDNVAAMIKAAADTGDAATLATTATLAKKTNPDSAGEIDALVAGFQKAADDAQQEKLAHQGFFDGWKGQGQAGGSISTGNTDSKGFSLGLSLQKTSLHWQHTILATADYQKDNGITSKERFFASYQADYKFSARWYALGMASWERDAFAGFTGRESEAVGIGYTAIKTPSMTLGLEAGPALRQTHYITGDSENRLAGRAAANYAWTISPNVLFTENAAYYGQSGDSTLTSTTALTMKVHNALSVQASFLYTHETNPPLSLKQSNTISRLALVYGF